MKEREFEEKREKWKNLIKISCKMQIKLMRILKKLLKNQKSLKLERKNQKKLELVYFKGSRLLWLRNKNFSQNQMELIFNQLLIKYTI